LEEFIKDTDSEKVSEKYQHLYKGASFYSDENEKIIDEVRKGKHVYIDWRSNLKYIMRREYLKTETCDFALSAEDFMEEQIALTLPLSSPYIEVFNNGRFLSAVRCRLKMGVNFRCGLQKGVAYKRGVKFQKSVQFEIQWSPSHIAPTTFFRKTSLLSCSHTFNLAFYECLSI
jgi:hypothetical protein